MARVMARRGNCPFPLQALVWLEHVNALVVRIPAPPFEVLSTAHRIHPIAFTIAATRAPSRANILPP